MSRGLGAMEPADHLTPERAAALGSSDLWLDAGAPSVGYHAGLATEPATDAGGGRVTPFPDGHFYSPIPDPEELARKEDRVWGPPRRSVPGLDLGWDRQAALLDAVQAFAAEYDYPPRAADAMHFQEINPFFSGLDSRMLFCLLRHLRPRRLIEVGSGFSSLLAADVNRRYFAGAIDVTCIDPYPQEFLLTGVPGISRLIEARVEDLEPERFTCLEAGDILFIDSSHVAKTANDVCFLYLEILPRLAPGVVVHAHDVFLPAEYPKEWVLTENRAWNEQYLLQALLMHSRGFRILFGSSGAFHFLADRVRSVFGDLYGGGSFWIERAAEPGGRTPTRPA